MRIDLQTGGRRPWFLKLAMAGAKLRTDERSIMRGMQAYTKARCNQCHLHSGHGVNLGPDLTKIGERFKGQKLLRQILEPSHEINKIEALEAAGVYDVTLILVVSDHGIPTVPLDSATSVSELSGQKTSA